MDAASALYQQLKILYDTSSATTGLRKLAPGGFQRHGDPSRTEYWPRIVCFISAGKTYRTTVGLIVTRVTVSMRILTDRDKNFAPVNDVAREIRRVFSGLIPESINTLTGGFRWSFSALDGEAQSVGDESNKEFSGVISFSCVVRQYPDGLSTASGLYGKAYELDQQAVSVLSVSNRLILKYVVVDSSDFGARTAFFDNEIDSLPRYGQSLYNFVVDRVAISDYLSSNDYIVTVSLSPPNLGAWRRTPRKNSRIQSAPQRFIIPCYDRLGNGTTFGFRRRDEEVTRARIIRVESRVVNKGQFAGIADLRDFIELRSAEALGHYYELPPDELRQINQAEYRYIGHEREDINQGADTFLVHYQFERNGAIKGYAVGTPPFYSDIAIPELDPLEDYTIELSDTGVPTIRSYKFDPPSGTRPVLPNLVSPGNM